jgi:hypothetical protein
MIMSARITTVTMRWAISITHTLLLPFEGFASLVCLFVCLVRCVIKEHCRYADCMVHRILDACIRGGSAVETKDTLKEICENCNERKARADRASERSDVVFLCHLFKELPPAELEGYVYKVSAKGFDVMVPE